MKIWTIEEEADQLSKRFDGVNRAAFARDYRVPGGQAMIYQHITGRRPIGLDAAQAYARGFNCTLEEISPRLAMEARKALGLKGGEETADQVKDATSPTALTKEQAHLISLMEGMSQDDKKTLVKVGAALARLSTEEQKTAERNKDRRKRDVGHDPDRRLGPDIPPDPHDTRLHEWPDETEQLQERKRR